MTAKPYRPVSIALSLAWAGWAAFAVWTIPTVPFHPDEATHIFLSTDYDRLVDHLDPASVTWQSPDVQAEVRRYRLLEAPLSRYLIGLGRALNGYGEIQLPVDWNWSASWTENSQAGALPASGLLTTARLPATVMTVLVPLLLTAIGRRMAVPLAGLLAGVLFALSGLAMLHGRRAMSEGPLLFCEVLLVWLAIRHTSTAGSTKPGPGLRDQLCMSIGLGLAVALAGTAKLTGWAMLPVAVAAIWLAPQPTRWSRMWQMTLLLVSALAGAWLLNPALWAAPAEGLREMVRARQAITAAQTGALGLAGPGLLLDSPGEKLLAQLYHGYVAPLAYWDIRNYAAETQAAEHVYTANWLNVGLRFNAAGPRLAAGVLLLAASMAGAAFAGLETMQAIRRGGSLSAIRPRFVIVIWTVAVIASLFAFSIAWQRYYVSLLPVVGWWAAGTAEHLKQIGSRPNAEPKPVV